MEPKSTAARETEALAFREQMVALVRAFGWHRPDQTPCGTAVPISEAHALIELARQETLPQHELGARLGLEKSTVSRLVGQLESRGWVQRQRQERDGRSVAVSLTEKGRQAEEQLAVARTEFFARLLAAIPEEKRRDMRDGLDLLLEALREQSS